MVQQRLPTAEIVNRINGAESRFSLFPEDVTTLRKKGVPEIIIDAMFARQTGNRMTTPTEAPTAAAIPGGLPAIPATAMVPQPRYPLVICFSHSVTLIRR